MSCLVDLCSACFETETQPLPLQTAVIRLWCQAFVCFSIEEFIREFHFQNLKLTSKHVHFDLVLCFGCISIVCNLNVVFFFLNHHL